MDKNGFGTKEEIKEVAEKIWHDMIGFSQYAFPKAHATSYAIIANATQWLKVNYPTEFFCSYLQYVTDDKYNNIKSIAEREYGVKFLLPEINLSKDKFIIHNGKIVWALTSIKGLGHKAAHEIVLRQPYASFEDFFERINKRVVTVRVVTCLITAGTFRKFGKRRKIVKKYSNLRKDKQYYEKYGNIPLNEWKFMAGEIMPYYKQSIRDTFRDKLGGVMDYDEFDRKDMGRRVVVAGIIENFRSLNSKRGEMFLFKVSDDDESYNVVCWNEMVKRLNKKGVQLKTGVPVKVSGIKNLSHIGEEQIALGKEKSCYIKILN